MKNIEHNYMNIKKYFIIFLLAMTVCLFMTACSSKPTDSYEYADHTIYKNNDNVLTAFQYHNEVIYALSNNDNGQQIVTQDITGDMDSYMDVNKLSELGEVRNFAFDTSGSLWFLSYRNETEKYTIHKFDDKKLIKSIDLDITYEYLDYFHIDSADQIYISFSGFDTGYYSNIFAYDIEGVKIGQIGTDNIINGIFELQGKNYITYYNDLGYMMAPFDMKNEKLGNAIFIDSDTLYSFLCSADPIGQYYCFYNNTGIYAVDRDGNKDLLFYWTDHGYVDPYFLAFYMTKDGSMICCNWDEIVVMERQLESDGNESEKVLTLASLYPNERLRSLTAAYNREQEGTTIIQLRDYSIYNTDTDPYGGLTKLNTEIIGGNIPDILDMSGIGTKQYVTAGLLEDLYPYLDEDPAFSREDLLEEVRQAMEIDEALYGLASTFTVKSVVARTAEFQKQDWTYQDFIELLSDETKKDPPFFNATKESMLELICTNTQDRWIDWDAYEVHFDTPEFVSLLQFCNELPSEKGIYNFFGGESDSFLDTANMGRFSTLQLLEAVWDDVTFIGYPESGNTIAPDMYLAMSAASENKKDCWAFIRTALEPEKQYQSGKNNDPGFPVNKQAFTLLMQDAMTESYDTNGQIVPKEGLGSPGGEQIDIYAATQAQVDQVLELIRSADKLEDGNKVITGIILEEARTYFSGNKTAEQAAEIIQNRLSTYIMEQQINK